LKVIGGPIIAEGRNCWRRPTADRIAFRVDAAQYYAAFIRAVERAERVVRILAWDINSRTLLGRAPAPRAAHTVRRDRSPRTFLSWRPLLALDRMWGQPRRALGPVRAHGTRLARLASDHLPIVATVTREG